MTPTWTPPVLESERLILRPVTPADAGAVFLYASNPAVTRHTLFETHQTITDSRWFVEDYTRSRYVSREPDPLAIVLKADPTRTPVGTLGAHWVSKSDGTMEIGYSVAEPYWGQGIAGEAALGLINYLFREYPVVRLQARVFVGNDASERVLHKLGFTREGVLRSAVLRRGRWWDLAMYSLLRAEWETRSRPG